MKKRWRPPFYETQMEEGLPHERMFGIMCVVNTFTEIGFGKSKRLAKRQAAYKMIQLIEKLQTTGTTNGESKRFFLLYRCHRRIRYHFFVFFL